MRLTSPRGKGPSPSLAPTPGGATRPDVRLLFLISGLHSGGAETQARYLITGLARRRVEVQLLAFGGEPAMLAEVEAAGVPITYLSLQPPKLWWVGALRRAHALARGRGIHLVQSFLPTMDVFAPLIRLWDFRYRVVTSRRSLDEYLSPKDLRRLRFTGRFAHRIVGNSQAVAESVARLEGFHPPQVCVIPNGIPMPEPITEEERAAARAAFGLDSGAFVVILVAHFRRGKGHEHVPEVAARLREAIPRAVVLLAGDPMRLEGRIYDAVRARLEAEGLLDRVRLLGDYRDSRRLHAAANVALNLSDSEGMSNSVLESMSQAVPVVATAVGGNVEVIRDRGDGRLVPGGSVAEGTVAALVELAADAEGCRALGQAARERTAREFSIDRMVDRYLELYDDLALSREGRD